MERHAASSTTGRRRRGRGHAVSRSRVLLFGGPAAFGSDRCDERHPQLPRGGMWALGTERWREPAPRGRIPLLWRTGHSRPSCAWISPLLCCALVSIADGRIQETGVLKTLDWAREARPRSAWIDQRRPGGAHVRAVPPARAEVRALRETQPNCPAGSVSINRGPAVFLSLESLPCPIYLPPCPPPAYPPVSAPATASSSLVSSCVTGATREKQSPEWILSGGNDSRNARGHARPPQFGSQRAWARQGCPWSSPGPPTRPRGAPSGSDAGPGAGSSARVSPSQDRRRSKSLPRQFAPPGGPSRRGPAREPNPTLDPRAQPPRARGGAGE